MYLTEAINKMYVFFISPTVDNRFTIVEVEVIIRQENKKKVFCLNLKRIECFTIDFRTENVLSTFLKLAAFKVILSKQ